MAAKVGEREGAGLVDPVAGGRGYGDGRRIFREGSGDGWGSAKLILYQERNLLACCCCCCDIVL